MPEINDRESLRDLDGVRLEMEPLPPFVIKQGLSAERLAAEIETQLRLADVNVFPMGEFRTGDPHLQMVVTVSDVQGHLIASRVEVGFVQICFLRRNPLVTFNRARTWTATAAVSIGPAAATAARVRRDVTRQIDQFIQDYKRVNE
jgi:hypothetical protein